MEYKIEKNIPINDVIGSRKYPFSKMEIGDSFIISEIYSYKIAQNISMMAKYHAKKYGYKFVVRKTLDNKIRIWRIK